MSVFTVKLEGLDKAMDVLKNLPEEKLDAIHAAFDQTIQDIAAEAKQNIASKSIAIAGRITGKMTGDLQGYVFVQYKNAAYVNFGTGPYAASYLNTVDPVWAEYARQFYVNGKGTMPAYPYFTSAVDTGVRALIQEVKEILLNK